MFPFEAASVNFDNCSIPSEERSLKKSNTIDNSVFVDDDDLFIVQGALVNAILVVVVEVVVAVVDDNDNDDEMKASTDVVGNATVAIKIETNRSVSNATKKFPTTRTLSLRSRRFVTIISNGT